MYLLKINDYIQFNVCQKLSYGIHVFAIVCFSDNLKEFLQLVRFIIALLQWSFKPVKIFK